MAALNTLGILHFWCIEVAGYPRCKPALSHEEVALEILRIRREEETSICETKETPCSKAIFPHGAYAERILENLQGVFAPMYGRVHERFWGSGAYACVRRPYYHVDWDQGLAEYYVPTVLNGENIMQYHRIIVSIYPYMDHGLEKSELGRLKTPIKPPTGRIDSESIILVAPKVSDSYARERRRSIRYRDCMTILRYLRCKGIIDLTDGEIEDASWRAASEEKKIFSPSDWREIMRKLSMEEQDELDHARIRARRREQLKWNIRGGYNHARPMDQYGSKHKGYRTLIIIEKSAEKAVKRIISHLRWFWKKRVIGMLRKLEIQPYQYDYDWRNMLRPEWDVSRRRRRFVAYDSGWDYTPRDANEERRISINTIISRGLISVIKNILRSMVATFIWLSDKLKAIDREVCQISILKSTIQAFSEEISPKLAALDPERRQLAAERLISMIESNLHRSPHKGVDGTSETSALLYEI